MGVRGRRWWAAISRSAVVVMASSIGFGSLPAVAVGAPSAAAVEFHDDMVEFDADTGELIERSAQGAATGAGYTTFPGFAVNAYRYTVKLISSPRVEQYRGGVQSVVNELNASGSVSINVASGAFSPPNGTKPAAHEIWVHAADTSPCGTAGGIVGCGSPSSTVRAAGNDKVAVAGQVWLHPQADQMSAGARRELVAHEFGHALGLDHFGDNFLSQRQVMYPIIWDSPTYQAGDRAGFSYLSRDVKPVGSIEAVTIPSTGKLRITGWAFDPDQNAAATVRLVVDGATRAQQATTKARPDVNTANGLPSTPNRGFDFTLDAAPGGHRVCLMVMDYPRSSFDQAGPCRQVTTEGMVTTNRIHGSDRFSSAVEVSKAGFPGTAPVVVVASAEAFPDALSAGPVAAKLGGPLLLTQASVLSAATKAEIVRLRPAKIVVAGGTTSVSDAALAELKSLASEVVRVGGDDRYDTSRRLAAHAFSSSATGYVASGEAFPDALAASAAAASHKAPLLLVAGWSAPIAAAAAEQLASVKTTSVRVVGGSAVLTEDVLSAIRKTFPNAKRVNGSDRFSSAVAVSADAFASPTSRVYLVSGMDFPDGLVTAPLASKTNSPVFLSPGYCVPPDVFQEMNRLGATTLTLIGGAVSLSTEVADLAVC